MAPLKKSIAALFADVKAGHTDAFNQLFMGYYKQLVVFARQYVKDYAAAEELTSAVFLKLWLKRDSLNQVNNPEVYLYVAVKNAALNHLRSVKKNAALTLDENMRGAISHGPANHTSNLDQKELHTIVADAVEALPEQRRLIYKMIKEDGLKCKDVAAILNISTRTVESQLYKAVKFLADRLSSYLGYHPQKDTTRKSRLSVNLFNFLMCL